MKSRFSAAILAFFLGTFGINNFYTGHVTLGVIDVLVSLLLSWTFVAPLVVTVVNIVRGCQYLWCNDDAAFCQKYVAGYNPIKLLND